MTRFSSTVSRQYGKTVHTAFLFFAVNIWASQALVDWTQSQRPFMTINRNPILFVEKQCESAGLVSLVTLERTKLVREGLPMSSDPLLKPEPTFDFYLSIMLCIYCHISSIVSSRMSIPILMKSGRNGRYLSLALRWMRLRVTALVTADSSWTHRAANFEALRALRSWYVLFWSDCFWCCQVSWCNVLYFIVSRFDLFYIHM